MANPNPGDAAIIMKIKAKMEKALPFVTDECCIYRVPHEIRKLKEDAYTPKVVSIGPFHHRDPNLQKMEGQKTIFFKEFIERTETKDLESFVSCVQKLELKVRGCYSDDIKLSEEEHVMVICSGNRDGLSLTNVGRIAHFTDLTRKLLLLSSDLSSECSREAQVTQLYSATQLREAGVKFESGGLYRSCWRNLLAFEQCHCMDKAYLADYAFVIDFLINTDKDVDSLIKNGIIENWLGDSIAVAKMFNGLGVNIVTPDFNEKYYCILKGLNDFCKKPWNRKVATLKRDYCNTPWKTVASIAGIFLLILTVVQTI
ncbi:UPF0481 protein [Arachis hypogaea]|nr:UPF0481 protein [Arachis hypogaea]